MKAFFLLLLLFFFAVNLYSQTENDKRNTISVYLAPGLWAAPGAFVPTLNPGVNYSRNLGKGWGFDSGVEMLLAIGGHLEMIFVPVQLRRNLGQRSYFHFGTSLDIVPGLQFTSPDAGLGWRLGVGFERERRDGLILTINPYVRWNRTVTLENLLGVKLGVGHRF